MATPTDQKLYDRIKAQVKRDAKSRWPSAYLSGQVVQKYKAAMEKKGIKPYKSSTGTKKGSSLGRWFREEWVNIHSGKPCGEVRTKTYYPTCRPKKRITTDTPRTVKELTAKQKDAMIKLKQKAKKKTVDYTKIYKK
ncbi:hypothetical protein FR483_N561R [Paramecium bursaria Chlorella virus FR483]|uniref:Uncharacterized protein N561R n=1 Tax=Paramecium bursaria Chlorella virus FR483 TaxID=399781 RepID=A7J7R5_PBCVF|nr:hypothetical protein FR483_N561R [Paramecium bursaria Chlorella virus FR483]ABT15846.1 hypothetical protein FR483_N561R [Paramecium bursaria Chlorella virus FR483]